MVDLGAPLAPRNRSQQHGKRCPLVHKVKDLTGPGLTDQFGIGGTDL
jgi:hypothetical protein